MVNTREGAILCDDPLITVEERTPLFLTIESERVTARICSVMWSIGYTTTGLTVKVTDGVYHSTFQKTHAS